MYNDFRRLYLQGYGHIRMTVSICALTVTVSLLEGLNIGLLVPLLENLDSNRSGNEHIVSQGFGRIFEGLGLSLDLGTILMAMTVMILMVAGLKYLRMVLVGRTVVGFVQWMRSKIMSNLLSTDVSYFHSQRLGTLTDAVTTEASLAGSTLSAMIEIITGAALVAAYLVAAFLISPILTAIAFVVLIAVALGMQFLIIRARALGKRLVDEHSELHSAVVESLSGIRVIKSFLLERTRSRDFDGKAADVAKTVYFQVRNRSLLAIFQETAIFGIVGLILFIGHSVMDVELAAILALLFVMFRLAPKATALNGHRQALATSMAGIDRVVKIMDETASPKIVTGGTQFPGFETGIELQNVDFAYDPSAGVLKSANLTIEKGKMTAVVGRSGAGKSTLVDLILRFYDPDAGAVLVDGQDLKTLDLAAWRRSIGLVSQDVFLFNDTIANNIGMGDPDASLEKIVESAKQAYADAFINELPMGYKTTVGDRGWNLSGGQRQRIALARAILAGPEILILDEATSSLDSESEQLILGYIKETKGTRTIVAVAHRLSTVQTADKIAVLEDGKIVEEGTWSELIEKSGVFANYYRIQVSEPELPATQARS